MFKYETHVHTSENDICAQVKAQDIVRMYQDAGYDGMVVTDHFFSLFSQWFADELKGADHHKIVDRWLRGYREARNAGERLGFTVLLGAEVRLDGTINDYLVYGLTETFLQEAPLLNQRKDLKELISLLPEDTCVVQAHPFRDEMTVQDPSALFGIEVYNGGTEPFRNELARLFAQHYGKRMLSGSDFHRAEHLARGGIATEKRIICQSDLIDTLRSGAYSLIATEV